MKKIITLKANDSVFEHSEKPKELKNLLNEIEFQAIEIRLSSLDNPQPTSKYKKGMNIKSLWREMAKK